MNDALTFQWHGLGSDPASLLSWRVFVALNGSYRLSSRRNLRRGSCMDHHNKAAASIDIMRTFSASPQFWQWTRLVMENGFGGPLKTVPEDLLAAARQRAGQAD